MERLILDRLLKWKNSPYRKPLILKGVRQVGKTWILKEFGRRYYENTAYFNFDEHEEYRQFFETTKDVDRILQNLMLASGQKIQPEKTLIIFDEVQDCPKVINSMKYFCENAPQYHIACAGSLLGIALAKPSSFPVGKVDFMRLYPMCFTEFLEATGYARLAELLGDRNRLSVRLPEGPYAYPFYCENGPAARKALAAGGIYIPTLWPEVPEDIPERDYVDNILPLPCDQRYGAEEMIRIAEELAHV